jgi:predicted MPP superfamily phosphohydrolase
MLKNKTAVLLLTLLLTCTVLSGSASQTKRAGAGEMLKAAPAVFAVEDNYQIFVTVTSPALVRIKIGNRFYSDHINGVRPTQKSVHRFTVPMAELEKAGGYEVFCRPMPQRLPYMRHLKVHPESKASFEFRKIPAEKIRIYHIGDTHSRIEQPLKSARAVGDFDLLILNGDIAENAGTADCLEKACLLAGKISKGKIPVIYARGNHELRGAFAEELFHYTPNSNGKSYYQVKLGPVWALVLDAGEDKVDTHPVYANAIDCDLFRNEQAAFIRQCSAEKSFARPGVKYRLVICHSPFPRYIGKTKADEENKRHFIIFGNWSQDLKKLISPDLVLSAHVHKTFIADGKEFPAPVIVGSFLDKRNNISTGALITLSPGKAQVEFPDQQGKSREKHLLPLKR